jgi:hypothetical protein
MVTGRSSGMKPRESWCSPWRDSARELNPDNLRKMNRRFNSRASTVDGQPLQSLLAFYHPTQDADDEASPQN